MKLSVLTVSYNSADTIRYTLDSFFAQDYADKELILVDGGSADGTVEIAKTYQNEEMVFLSEPDEGMYDALNKALTLYSGDGFGVLNSDDKFHSDNVLSLLAAALDNADVAHGDLDFVTGHECGSVVRRWRASAMPDSGFRRGWMPAHPTFYVRRWLADKTGSFDLQYKVASDYDWMMRALMQPNVRLATLNKVLIDMRYGGTSTSGLGAILKHNLEAMRSRRNNLGAGLLDYAFFAKPLGKIGQLMAGR